MSCVDAIQAPGSPPGEPQNTTGAIPDYAWTDLTYLLYKHHVSWRYYVAKGNQPDCADNAMFCAPVPQSSKTPGIWNPLPWFDTVRKDAQLANIAPLQDLYTAARNGTLPAVSWIAPAQAVGEHPPGLVSAGQSYVTGLINTIMRSKDWSSTAIFLSWDDWGGFYDHVVPPKVDVQGYGLRVPGARDQPVRAARLHRPPGAEPRRVPEVHRGRLPRRARASTRRPTAAPTRGPNVRENAAILGDLRKDFNFSAEAAAAAAPAAASAVQLGVRETKCSPSSASSENASPAPGATSSRNVGRFQRSYCSASM